MDREKESRSSGMTRVMAEYFGGEEEGEIRWERDLAKNPGGLF